VSREHCLAFFLFFDKYFIYFFVGLHIGTKFSLSLVVTNLHREICGIHKLDSPTLNWFYSDKLSVISKFFFGYKCNIILNKTKIVRLVTMVCIKPKIRVEIFTMVCINVVVEWSGWERGLNFSTGWKWEKVERERKVEHTCWPKNG
jgi:hypothetical protein